MSESNDYDPGVWKGYNFASARKAFDANAGRSYGDAVSAKVSSSDLLPNVVETVSKRPLVILSDVTGSMGEWPAVIFSKLPYLDLEGKQYLGEDMEICFAAIGDANCDNYPLQVRQFAKGLDMKAQLEKLVIEGGGGGQTMETYDLGALYFARNFRFPNAVSKPIVIFIGDEQPYDYVKRAQADRYAKVSLNQDVSTEDVFAELKEKCAVYLVRKPYDVRSAEPEIRGHWENLVGNDHIVELPDAARIVDVIFGILAQETNKVAYFRDEIEGRQRADQVKTVYKSLATVHAAAPKLLGSGKSTMFRSGSGVKSKSLLDGD